MRQLGVWGNGAGRGPAISYRHGHPWVLQWLCKTIQTHHISCKNKQGQIYSRRGGWEAGLYRYTFQAAE